MPRYYYNKVFTQFDRENMIMDRFLNPPAEFFWQGQRYSSEAERDSARASTLSQNLRSTLTPTERPPTKSRLSGEEKFKKRLDQFVTDFNL